MVPFKSLGTVSYLPSIVTMAVSLAISEIFSVNQWPDLEIWVWSHSRSLKMARFDRPWVRGHSRSSKLVLVESLGAVFYSSSIVTMAVSIAVCEIFSVRVM